MISGREDRSSAARPRNEMSSTVSDETQLGAATLAAAASMLVPLASLPPGDPLTHARSLPLKHRVEITLAVIGERL